MPIRRVIKGRGLVKNRTGGGVIVTPEDPTPTPPPLPNPPVILSITEESLTDTGVNIRIVVDQPCQCQTFYDTNSGTVVGDYPNSTALESSFTYTEHLQRISGALPGTNYFYRVRVTNTSNQTTLSAEGTFTTTGSGGAPDPETGLPSTAVDPLVYIAQPAQTRPGLLTTTSHPNFGTQVTKVSPIDGQRHRYSSKAAWSCDESWLILDKSPGRPLLNGQTMALVKNNNDTKGAFTWSQTVGNKAYASDYLNGPPRMIVYQASNSGLTIVSQPALTALSGTYIYVLNGGNYGVPSLDDHWIAFVYKKSNGWHGIGIARTDTWAVVAELDIKNDAAPNDIIGYVSMSPDGNHVVWSTGISSGGSGTALYQGAWVADFNNGSTPSLSTRRQLTIDAGHMDVAQLRDGTNVLAMVSQSATGGSNSGNYGFYRMTNGAWTRCGGGSGSLAFGNGHTSARCIRLKGYFLLSSHSTSATNFPGKSLVFLVDMDDPGRHVPFAHTHIVANSAYADETQACISPSGDRVIWAANWDNVGYTASYVAGLDVIR